MFKRIVLSVLTFLIITTCAVNPVTGKREFMLISEEQEIKMGQEYDPQISSMYGVYQDEKLSKYIDGIGQKMAKISHRSNLKYDIKVMDSPVINAFAVPGGYVYITRGILAYLNNEAELAGVMGHEIGHVTARHSAKQQSKAQLAQIGLGLGSIFSEGFAEYAGLAGQAVGLLFLKFGRDDERQSDELGVEYSSKVGYDAREMANFFGVLDQMNKGSKNSLPDFMSTHPNPEDRVVDVTKRAEKWQKKNPGNYAINEEQYLKMIDGIVFGNDPRQGFVENDIFYHPELKFQFPTPAGWTINNLPTQVQMIPADEKGVMIFKLESTKDQKIAANTLITNNKMTVISHKSVNVYGAPAEEVIGTVNTENGVLKIMAYFINTGGNVYSFLGYSGQGDFDNYVSAFKATMTGLQPLKDRSKLEKKPDRVKVEKISKATSLQAAFKSFGVADEDLKTHSLLNGAKPLTDNVAAGSYIKIVVKGK